MDDIIHNIFVVEEHCKEAYSIEIFNLMLSTLWGVPNSKRREDKLLFIDVRYFEQNYFIWAMLRWLIYFQFSGAGAIFLYL